jgi:hypothetical protein
MNAPRPLAQHLYDCLLMDAWPRAAAVVDWGIDSPDHLGALQDAIRGGATAADLDAVCGDGPGITAMVADRQGPLGHRSPSLAARYHATFVTAYDA